MIQHEDISFGGRKTDQSQEVNTPCRLLHLIGGILVLSILMTTGCGTAGICMVEEEKSSVVFKEGRGRFREVPQIVVHDGIMTLQRTETNRFLLRMIGFDGREMSRKDYPLFMTSYGSASYAFSDDGENLAYVNWGLNQCRRLFVRSPKDRKGEDKCLMDIPDTVYDAVVMWTAPDVILFSLKGLVDTVYLINVKTGKIIELCDQTPSYGPLQLSASKRYLLVSEGRSDCSGVYLLNIFDLASQKKIAEIIPAGTDMGGRGALWNGDDEIVYATDNKVYMQNIWAKGVTKCFEMKPQNSACLYAIDGKQNLHYQTYKRKFGGGQVGGWYIFNLKTGVNKQLTSHRITGRVRLSPERNIVVAEVGL